MKKYFLIGVVVLLLIVSVFLVFFKEKKVLSPLAEWFEGGGNDRNMEITGFLPTWMVGKTKTYGKEIDRLIFLGIEVKEDGDLLWDFQSKKINNDSYLEIKAEIKKNKGKNIVGFKLFKDNKLDKLLKNELALENFLDKAEKLVKDYEMDGVNIDFEFQNNIFGVYADDFLSFLDKLDKRELGEISIDVFANTIIKAKKDNLENLIRLTDKIIVMAYDFHRPGSIYAGPVAPIKSEVGERNIVEIYEKLSQIDNNQRDKFIVAYPLYGYEWKTETKEHGSKTLGKWYQMASMNRISQMEGMTERWDELSMSPWLFFEEKGDIRQIYYENEKSLKIKVDLARQNKIKGVAFWALGYEDKSLTFNKL
jgi:spore germination protein YaaH